MDLQQNWTGLTIQAHNNAIASDAKSLYQFFRNIKITLAYFNEFNSFVDDWLLKSSALKNFLISVDHQFTSIDAVLEADLYK
jgi:hypothetical protein